MKKFYALVCVNEEFEVVSIQNFATLEEAQEQMQQEYEKEMAEAYSQGYGKTDMENNCVSTTAYVEYGEESKYHWSIKKSAF